MTGEQFAEIIDQLLDLGVEITLEKRDGVIWYNLNTGMKSDLRLAQGDSDDEGIWKGRYDSGTFDDFDDVIYQVERCMCGRDFASALWFDAFAKLGRKLT